MSLLSGRQWTWLVFLFACGLLSGCGSRDMSKDKARSKVGEGKQGSAALAPEAAWTDSPAEMRYPAVPVSGRIRGKAFVPNHVQFSNGVLIFRQGQGQVADVQVEIPTGLHESQPLEGRQVEVTRDRVRPPSVILATSESVGTSRDPQYAPSYVLKLEFARVKDGQLPARVYLCLMDPARSFLAGEFALEVGPVSGGKDRTDTPLVRGSISVRGDTKGTIEIGYLGQPLVGNWIADRVRGTFVRGTVAESLVFAPRTTRLEFPASAQGRFLCRRLPPGRYFFHANWNERAADWRWLDVTGNDQLSLDFTVDPSRTGSLDVQLPRSLATHTVRVVPLDPNGQFPSLPFPLARLTERLKSEATPKAGKAILDRLPAGRYRVLAGDARANVEVRAGATVPVVLTEP